MNITASYSVYLYTYKKKLNALSKVRDIGDIVVPSEDFSKRFLSTPYTSIISDESLNAMPENLRKAFQDNARAQKLQFEADATENWLDPTTSNAKMREELALYVEELKQDLTAIINSDTDDPDRNEYISRITLADGTTYGSSGASYVLDIHDFSTSVVGFKNECSLSLAKDKIDALTAEYGRPVPSENDVIEIVSHTENGDRPIFYGFVTSVSTTETYNQINSAKIECHGIHKFAALSRALKVGSPTGGQFDIGVDLSENFVNVMSTIFNDYTVENLFEAVMTNMFFAPYTPQLQPAIAEYVDPAFLYTRLYRDLSNVDTKLVNDHLLTRKYRSVTLAWITQHSGSAYGNIADPVLLALNNLPPESSIAADEAASTVSGSVRNESFYKDANASYLTAIRSLTEAQDTGETENTKKTYASYQKHYTINKETLTTKLQSLQFSAHLITLYFMARSLSPYGASIAVDGMSAQTAVGIIQASSEAYKVYLEQLRSDFSSWYSQATLPIDLLNDIRTNAMLDVFEDRPGIIRCRPPRYNLWYANRELPKEIILSKTYTQNDSNLLSRRDYQPQFAYTAAPSVPRGSSWTDKNVLMKYGLRSEDPRLSPNVRSVVFSAIWAALDLMRANSATRTLTVTVPADAVYDLGELYYIPETEISDTGESSGVVGYLSDITTQIRYGSVGIHVLRFSYIRKASKELVYPNAATAGYSELALNFKRLPDVETLMQTLQNPAADNKPSNKRDQTGEGIPDNPENARYYGGYYWAVSPECCADFDDYVMTANNYNPQEMREPNIPDGWTKDRVTRLLAGCWPTRIPANTQFNYSGNNVPLKQELVNRIWLADTLRAAKSQPKKGYTYTFDKPSSAKQNAEALTRKTPYLWYDGFQKGRPSDNELLLVLNTVWLPTATKSIGKGNARLVMTPDININNGEFVINDDGEIERHVIVKNAHSLHGTSRIVITFGAPIKNQHTFQNMAASNVLMLDQQNMKKDSAHAAGNEFDTAPSVLQYMQYNELFMALRASLYPGNTITNPLNCPVSSSLFNVLGGTTDGAENYIFVPVKNSEDIYDDETLTAARLKKFEYADSAQTTASSNVHAWFNPIPDSLAAHYISTYNIRNKPLAVYHYRMTDPDKKLYFKISGVREIGNDNYKIFQARTRYVDLPQQDQTQFFIYGNSSENVVTALDLEYRDAPFYQLELSSVPFDQLANSTYDVAVRSSTVVGGGN